MRWLLWAAGGFVLVSWLKRAAQAAGSPVDTTPADLNPYIPLETTAPAGGTLLGYDALGQANIADGNGGISVNDQPKPFVPNSQFTLDLNGIKWLWQSPQNPWEPYKKLGVSP